MVKGTSVSPAPRRRSYGRSSPLAVLSAALVAVLLIGAWIALAPTPVGGRASYIIVNGNSMEPRMSLGDLAVVREPSGPGGYEVGDVVAYRHPQIGPVIHRIVGRDGERFVFEGDNNTWVDSYRPVESELIGKLWIDVPRVGKFFGWLRNPVSMAVLVAVMGVIAMNSFDTVARNRPGGDARPRRGRNPERGSSGPGDPPGGSPGKQGGGPLGGLRGESAEGALTLLGALLLASLILGFFAFTRPASVPVSSEAAYRHTGEFSYSADAPKGIYDAGEARTGDPVFPRVSDEVEVRFDYRLRSDLPAQEVEGTYRLVAEIADESSWKRTIPLEPETPFSGGSFTAVGTLDLEKVRELTGRVQKRTGAESSRYSVTVIPRISTTRALSGQPLVDEFSPGLEFWLDSLRLQLQTPITADGGQLSPSREGSLEGPSERTQTNTLAVLFFDLGVPLARVLSVAGLALSAGGLLLVGLPKLRDLGRGDEPTRIRARYGPMLVSVSSARGGLDPEDELHRIEVSTFEDLAKVADRTGQSILHRQSGGLHDYYVHDLSAVYHYAAVGRSPEAGPEDALIGASGPEAG